MTSSKGSLGELARDRLCKPYWPTPYLPGPLQTLVAGMYPISLAHLTLGSIPMVLPDALCKPWGGCSTFPSSP